MVEPRIEVKKALYQYRFRRYITSDMLPKPPKGCCKWCGGKLPGRKRSWCSKECQEEAYIRLGIDISYRIKARDNGICAKCGVDCKSKKTNNWKCTWEIDHIIPVSEGGGCCGFDNLRTLCIPCHKEETVLLAARNAEKRRNSISPQLQLF